MILFLTSNLGGYKKVNGNPVTTNMDNTNGFVDDVKSELKSIKDVNFCFFCSSPDKFDKTDMFAKSVKQSFELDGFTFAEKFLQTHKNTSVVFVSAHNANENRIRGFSMGSCVYIEKPFDVTATRAQIASVLKLKKLPKTRVKKIYED